MHEIHEILSCSRALCVCHWQPLRSFNISSILERNIQVRPNQLPTTLRHLPSFSSPGMTSAPGTGHRLELERSTPDEQLELEESLYFLSDPAHADELAFWKAATGIQDEVQLKEHIIAVQREAYVVFTYPCIRSAMTAHTATSRS